MPSRWLRGLLVLASAVVLAWAAWGYLHPAPPSPPDPSTGLAPAPPPAWADLAAGGELFWTSAVVLFGAGLAWLRGPDRGRVLLLLAGSFYFYASWNPYLACPIFVSTILDYFLAHGIERLRPPGWCKALVAVSVTANLGLLCYFKYTNFFLSSLEAALQRRGAAASIPLLQILAPMGISFYTFEAINYEGRVVPPSRAPRPPHASRRRVQVRRACAAVLTGLAALIPSSSRPAGQGAGLRPPRIRPGPAGNQSRRLGRTGPA